MKNVTLINGNKIKLPETVTDTDTGYNQCGTPFIVLADVSDTTSWKNDVTGIAMIADTITVELEEEDGTLITALGDAVTFPNQTDATGFVIDWRQHLIQDGAGCYKVKVSYDINGFTGSYYQGSYNLLPYSITASENTVRIKATYNDYVKQENINYLGSDFQTSMRFFGYFGDEQINSEHNNILQSNDVRKKVRNFSAPLYTLRTRPLNRCFTRPLKKLLLNASDFYISDYNVWAHEEYKDFNVILSENSSIEMEGEETHVRSITAEFLDKNWKTESRFSSGN